MEIWLSYQAIIGLAREKPSYYGSVYERLDDDTYCEGVIGLNTVSVVEFIDDGHAIAWAMQQSRCN